MHDRHLLDFFMQRNPDAKLVQGLANEGIPRYIFKEHIGPALADGLKVALFNSDLVMEDIFRMIRSSGLFPTKDVTLSIYNEVPKVTGKEPFDLVVIYNADRLSKEQLDSVMEGSPGKVVLSKQLCADYYRQKASEMFGVGIDDVTPEQRKAAKERHWFDAYGGVACERS